MDVLECLRKPIHVQYEEYSKKDAGHHEGGIMEESDQITLKRFWVWMRVRMKYRLSPLHYLLK